MAKMLRFFLLFCLPLSSLALPRPYQYQMDGTYQVVLPMDPLPVIVDFKLSWREDEGVIEGVYRDNYFASSDPVTGSAGINGRFFNIQLSKVAQGVSTMAMNTTEPNLQGNTLPVMVFLRDATSQTITQTTIQAGITTLMTPTEVESQCDVGFGALTEFCGLYAGRLQEISDSKNLCNLPDYGFRLELNTDARFNLFFYYSDTTIGIPTHNLNALTEAPLRTEIDQSTRHCGMLPGTSFNEDGCQILRLRGQFEANGNLRSFRGSYEISEEQGTDNCRYELNLEREKGY